ncbi:MAG: glycosyltransferase family 2 protein [Planctomycetia bacterium]|nr:glycosyltransferase family 2 protein [Planctomycetia bacterium]
MKLSIVIPVYNEEESLPRLLERIDSVTQANGYTTEIVLIDDGSTDASWQVITELRQKYPGVMGIRFRRNFGKAAALQTGFEHVSGDFVMTMDADLQDDPAEIPRFLEKMAEGFDVVSGWKKIRHDPWHKVGPSRVFNKMVSGLTGVSLHDHNCGMKCYRAEVLKEVHLYGELHRFIPVLAASRGFRVSEIVVTHHAREFGVSKYGFSRFLKGFLDLLSVKFVTSFGQRPNHFLGGFGVVLLGLGVGLVLLAWLFSLFCMAGCLGNALWPMWLCGRVEILGFLAMILGGQGLGCGLVAELVTRSHQNPTASNCSIREILEKVE